MDCARCAVTRRISIPATYLVPSGPPSFRKIGACDEHSLPYKTRKKLPVKA